MPPKHSKAVWSGSGWDEPAQEAPQRDPADVLTAALLCKGIISQADLDDETMGSS